MEWRGSQTATYRPWVVLAGAVIGLGGAALVAFADGVAAGWSGVLCLAAGGFVALAGIVFGRVVLTLDDWGVHLSFGPWDWPRRDVPWLDVRSATVVDVRWLPWGGWGMRWRPRHGTAALMRQGPGVQFGLADGRVLVVTVDHPDSAVAAANAWLGSRPD